MKKTCALTGHRDLPGNFNQNKLYDALEEMIKKGCDRFLCGMAAGFDLAALNCLADLRRNYKITLVACVPYKGQERGFSVQDKTLYRRLIEACDERVVLHETYTAGCLLERDRYMVDRADVLFAYCVREKGGAAYTVSYAEKLGIPVEKMIF